MPVFFNPAATLTANRIPYALGAGRLGDSMLLRPDDNHMRFRHDSNATANVQIRSDSISSLQLHNYDGTGAHIFISARDGTHGFPRIGCYDVSASLWRPLQVNASSDCVFHAGAHVEGGGKLQLGSHTTAAGGIGFGSDASLFRSGAQALSVKAAPASALALRNITISTDAPPTPWTGADGDIWIQREA